MHVRSGFGWCLRLTDGTMPKPAFGRRWQRGRAGRARRSRPFETRRSGPASRSEAPAGAPPTSMRQKLRAALFHGVDAANAVDEIGAVAEGQEAHVDAASDDGEDQDQGYQDGEHQDNAQAAGDEECRAAGELDREAYGGENHARNEKKRYGYQEARSDDVAVNEECAQAVQQQSDEVHF